MKTKFDIHRIGYPVKWWEKLLTVIALGVIGVVLTIIVAYFFKWINL
jgi:hypothetical protein